MSGLMRGIYKAERAPGAVYRTDLPVPEIGPRDILVNVRAAAICGTDLHIMSWAPYAQERLPGPMVFGHEFSGVVEKVGPEVTEFAVGDRIAGETHIPCNECYQCRTNNRHICENMKIIGVHVPGAFADYISMPADCAYKIKNELSFEQGAMLEPLGVGVHGVDAGDVFEKDVIIYGCGPIGLMAIGAARVFGAKTITAIDMLDRKLRVAGEMGADYLLNGAEEDVEARVRERVPQGVDVVIDYTGAPAAITAGFHVLRKGGRFVMVGLPGGALEFNFTDNVIYKEAEVIGVTGRRMYETWEQCEEVLSDERFNFAAVTGGIYPMAEFGRAFADILAGAPGKMLLIP